MTPAPSKTVTPGETSIEEPPYRVVSRVMNNYRVTDTGCWESGYSTASHGYAQVGWTTNGRARLWLAHRVAWFSANGSIPTGMTVDHICRERRCINPIHLRLLSNWDNARRNGSGEGDFPSEWSCKRNHDPGRRSRVTGVCLDCHLISCKNYLSKTKRRQ